jgi:hypothetical protein
LPTAPSEEIFQLGAILQIRISRKRNRHKLVGHLGLLNKPGLKEERPIFVDSRLKKVLGLLRDFIGS